MKTIYIGGMKNRDDFGLKVAEHLLRIQAVKLSPNKPFTWASGLKSPIYCDNRKTLSFPMVRTYLRQQFAEVIAREFGKPDMIAGVATGGIAMGVLVAQELGLPFCYVRAEAKGHGLGNRIEGVVEKGQTCVVIEDLISTGKSSLSAVDALREAGAEVKGMTAIFTYDFESAGRKFKDANVKLFTLSDYHQLLKQAAKAGYIEDAHMETLAEWRKDPEAWSRSFSETNAA
jgi:orotate phosphoribosyltransferase